MSKKKTFIFYNDWTDYTEEMTLEEKGQFFQLILDYQNGKKIGNIGGLKFIWTRVKKQLDEDKRKRQEKVIKRKEAGRLGGLKTASKKKQMLANAKKKKQMLAKDSKFKQIQAVNVNVNVNENVNVNKNVFNKKSFEYKIAKIFYNYQKEYMQVQNQITKKGLENYLQIQADEVRKLKRLDKYSEKLIEAVIHLACQDDFWKNNILSIAKLRKKNKDGNPYFVVIWDLGKKIQEKKSKFLVNL